MAVYCHSLDHVVAPVNLLTDTLTNVVWFKIHGCQVEVVSSVVLTFQSFTLLYLAVCWWGKANMSQSMDKLLTPIIYQRLITG